MSDIIRIEPIGCVCGKKKKLISEICGHLSSDVCSFDCYKCIKCKQLFRYESWAIMHLQYCTGKPNININQLNTD
jgi:hypothetical protein